MSTPEIVAARWIKSQLLANLLLAPAMGLAPEDMPARIFENSAPQGTPDVHITFNKLSGVDNIGVGGTTVWSNMTYAVRWHKETTDLAELDDGATQIKAALHKQMGTVTGGRVDGCYQTESYSKQSQQGDVIDSELGGVFRLYVITTG